MGWKVRGRTGAVVTVTAEGWNGMTGLLNVALTMKVELDKTGARPNVRFA